MLNNTAEKVLDFDNHDHEIVITLETSCFSGNNSIEMFQVNIFGMVSKNV